MGEQIAIVATPANDPVRRGLDAPFFRLLRTARRLLLCSFVVAGCGDPDTGGSLAIEAKEDGIQYRAHWTYRSFDVDVDLTLVTFETPDSCTTTATLVVNDVVSEEAEYALAPTDCSLLRMNEIGDIVLHGAGTGHDWTDEELSVDTDVDTVVLGPARVFDEPSGETRTYRFTLAAPPCPDAPDDCDCGALRRSGGPEPLALDLGRRCD